MLREISKIAETSDTLEEILDRINDYCRKAIDTFQTLTVFVDRGFPTFCYIKENKKVLLNLSVPWESIAGECIRERKQIITYAPSYPAYFHYPAQRTGFDIAHIIAKPLSFLNTTFGCIEFLMEREPRQVDVDLFRNIGDYFAPIIYLQEWHNIERRKAHAIKNKAFTGILTLFDNDIDEAEKQSTINEAFNEISLLSEDFLKLASLKCEMQSSNISDIVLTVSEKLNRLAKFNNADVKIRHELAEGLELLCDEFAIREEVLFNIVKNVWEEWQRRQQVERVLEFRTYRDGDYAVIEIRDNAGGIPEKVVSRFFLPFESAKGRGRGVGMNIAHQVMKWHNGEITFDSRLGDGTTFYIRLSMFNEDMRRFSRLNVDRKSELVSLAFEEHVCTGILLDVSMGGMLGLFKVNAPYPHISSSVMVFLELGANNSIMEINGLVARIEVLEGYKDPEYIKVAVKFTDVLDLKKKECLMKALSVL
ncbi:ATP-binding region, ATPase-like domain protein [Candidatus Magnetobacterium bavaricum]|uniref:histidine kinase n=1 Tax=Candidatus Magnetobacterium bavaricum TaxID=29290 RepID=A0A0F3GYF2_9BACT|nr:ATP-binding region, ATPase-like domain protein [Candidatus Magnetobacterium bavaricum]